MSNSAPIGVFDSGIGGLTVVRELLRQLPHEHLVYFGDTARVPYGPKSQETVTRYSMEIATFLLEQGVKAIVVACNTATAYALSALQQQFPVPVIGVIEPGAYAAAEATRNQRVGVIGTIGTINSSAYHRAITYYDPEIHVAGRACPLFVPLAEEGWIDREATRLIASEYLSPFKDDGIDTLVLGCTHYPLLKPVIQDVVGTDIQLIDSAEQTAARTATVLRDAKLAAAHQEPARLRCIASDLPDQFLRVGQRFLGAAIERVETIALGEHTLGERTTPAA